MIKNSWKRIISEDAICVKTICGNRLDRLSAYAAEFMSFASATRETRRPGTIRKSAFLATIFAFRAALDLNMYIDVFV